MATAQPASQSVIHSNQLRSRAGYPACWSQLCLGTPPVYYCGYLNQHQDGLDSRSFHGSLFTLHWPWPTPPCIPRGKGSKNFQLCCGLCWRNPSLPGKISCTQPTPGGSHQCKRKKKDCHTNSSRAVICNFPIKFDYDWRFITISVLILDRKKSKPYWMLSVPLFLLLDTNQPPS